MITDIIYVFYQRSFLHYTDLLLRYQNFECWRAFYFKCVLQTWYFLYVNTTENCVPTCEICYIKRIILQQWFRQHSSPNSQVMQITRLTYAHLLEYSTSRLAGWRPCCVKMTNYNFFRQFCFLTHVERQTKNKLPVTSFFVEILHFYMRTPVHLQCCIPLVWIPNGSHRMT